VVYDITKATSFKTLKTWIEELQAQGPKDIAIAIAGNKADLQDKRV
jgi:GTPase SAR1 family protein